MPEEKIKELRATVIDPTRNLALIGWAIMGAGGAIAVGGLVMAAWAKYC